MVTISGIKFPTTGKVLRAPKTQAVLAYTRAMREGKGQAGKVLKTIRASALTNRKK